MSSSYSLAAIEARKAAELKRQLLNHIEQLQARFQSLSCEAPQQVEGVNISLCEIDTASLSGGYKKSISITGEMLCEEKDSPRVEREEMDLSALIKEHNKERTPIEKELDSWVNKATERPILTQKDQDEYMALQKELGTILANDLETIEKVERVKTLISAYLGCAGEVSDEQKNRIDSMYARYCVLCKMLDVVPTERIPERVEMEVNRMMDLLEKRSREEYIMKVIEEIMTDLGCHPKDDAVLEDMIGQMFAVEGQPLCEVFVGSKGDEIMFEPVGETREGTLEERRQIERSADHVCSLYSELERRAAEKGVLLKRVYSDPASIESMHTHSEVKKTAGRKQTTSSILKERAVGGEE